MNMLNRFGAAGLALTLSLSLASPVVAGTIYSWKTEDGDVAFADNAKNVPARYRDAATTRASADLSEYPKYTSKHAEGTSLYEKQLAERVERLRRINAEAVDDSNRQSAYDSSGRSAYGRTEINVGGLSLSLEGQSNREPIIVERVRVRRRGQIASRHDTIVRQGDRTLAILRGRQEGELGASSRVVHEDELGQLYR